jgi:Nuclease-related domain
MPDPNEELVKKYLEAKGFFVMANVPVPRPKERTNKQSSGYGDIDLLALHPDGRRFLLEVKGWHTESFTPSYFDSKPYVDGLSRRVAFETFGRKPFKTILVVPRVGSRSATRVRELAQKEGISEIWEFGPLIQELLEGVKPQENQRSEALQVLRLVKIYKVARVEGRTEAHSLAQRRRDGRELCPRA